MLFGTQNTFWVAGYGVFISSNRIMFECLFARGSLSHFPTRVWVESGQGFLLGTRADITCETRKQVHFPDCTATTLLRRIRLVKPPRNSRSLVSLRNVQHFS